MKRFHATDKGNIPFTAAEETARDAEESKAAADQQAAALLPDKRAALAAAIDAANADALVPAKMKAVFNALKAVV